ncbi:MAG: Ppx/GppA phosphatase family protein [Armatimonadota bacterium]
MRTISVIDIGTNSIRLAVVRIDPNHDYRNLSIHKEVIRLGEGEFAHNRITAPAMDRGLLVLKKFADIARRYNSQEIVVAATAAVREAQNRTEFVERAKQEADVDVKIIPGVEEARLIYLGIASGIDMTGGTGLFIDIGGGTTEVIVGDQRNHLMLDSLKLGAIRLTDIFMKNDSGSVTDKRYKKIIDYARGVASNAVRKIRDIGFDAAYGSSGTIINLAEITAKRLNPDITSIRNYNLRYSDLIETITIMREMSLEQRRNLPGINPDRADIIICGGAIIDAIMSSVRADSITISDRALRDGLVIDHLFAEEAIKEKYHSISVRERSILQFGNACRFDERHAINVSNLAESLYKQLGELGVLKHKDSEQELLRYASLIHDIGTFISYGDHHRHSYYLIRNWNILGFTDEEIEMIATAALCHRKLTPSKTHLAKLNPQAKKTADILSSILRISDALDRSQTGIVKEIICRLDGSRKRLVLEVYASEDCPLEMWALESKKLLFERVFGLDVSIKRVISSN